MTVSATHLLTVAFDTEWNATSETFSKTTSVTVPAGASHLSVLLANAGDTPAIFTHDSKVLLRDDTAVSGGAALDSHGYHLDDPAEGTFDILLDSGGGSSHYTMFVIAIFGAGGVGDVKNAGDWSVDKSLSMATEAGDLVIDVISSDVSAIASAGQTTVVPYQDGGGVSTKVATGTSTAVGWTHAGTWTAMVATVYTTAVAGDTITPDSDNITDGDLSNDYTFGGFPDGAPDEGALDGAPVNVTSSTYDNIDSSLVADGSKVPSIGSISLVLSNGTGSAAYQVTNNLKAGHIEVTMQVLNTVLPEALHGLLQVAGQVLESDDRVRLDASDGSSVSNAGVQDILTYPKHFTVIKPGGTAYQYRLIDTDTVVPATSQSSRRRCIKAKTTSFAIEESVLTFDGEEVSTPCGIFISASGGVTNNKNGEHLGVIDIVGDQVMIDGVAVSRPVNLYRSPNGVLSTVPNGKPIATFN
jgi:hypothetical protein